MPIKSSAIHLTKPGVPVDQAVPVTVTSLQRWRLLWRIKQRWDVASDVRNLLLPDVIQPAPSLAKVSRTVVFYRVADPNAELDRVVNAIDTKERKAGRAAADADLNELPYWAELWESSEVLAAIMASQDLRGFRVLDIGCGLGLAGVGAVAAGAQVMLGDFLSAPLLFARLNVLGAGGKLGRLADTAKTGVGIREGEIGGEVGGRGGVAEVRKIDWSKDRLGIRFDIILGADIVYDRMNWQYLLPFFAHHLHPGGTVILAEPGRPTGADFITHAADKGWDVQMQEKFIPGGRHKLIRVMRLTNPPPPHKPPKARRK